MKPSQKIELALIRGRSDAKQGLDGARHEVAVAAQEGDEPDPQALASWVYFWQSYWLWDLAVETVVGAEHPARALEDCYQRTLPAKLEDGSTPWELAFQGVGGNALHDWRAAVNKILESSGS